MGQIMWGRRREESVLGVSHTLTSLRTHRGWGLFVFLWLCRWSGVSVSSVILSTIRTKTKVTAPQRPARGRQQPRDERGKRHHWRHTLAHTRTHTQKEEPFTEPQTADCYIPEEDNRVIIAQQTHTPPPGQLIMETSQSYVAGGPENIHSTLVSCYQGRKSANCSHLV